jgi:hypothetical protein
MSTYEIRATRFLRRDKTFPNLTAGQADTLYHRYGMRGWNVSKTLVSLGREQPFGLYQAGITNTKLRDHWWQVWLPK